MIYKKSSIVTIILASFITINVDSILSDEISNDFINFLMPNTLECGKDIYWSKLKTWHGEGGKCGQGLLYSIVGNVPTIKDGYIKAKIVIPEDNNREWPAYNGAVHEINNNKFEVHFCITTRLSTRPIWFQAYNIDGKKHGNRCSIKIVGVHLED